MGGEGRGGLFSYSTRGTRRGFINRVSRGGAGATRINNKFRFKKTQGDEGRGGEGAKEEEEEGRRA